MAQTLEVVASRRQRLVRDLCTQLKRELDADIQKLEGWEMLRSVKKVCSIGSGSNACEK